jgi:hypothetical protein
LLVYPVSTGAVVFPTRNNAPGCTPSEFVATLPGNVIPVPLTVTWNHDCTVFAEASAEYSAIDCVDGPVPEREIV